MSDNTQGGVPGIDPAAIPAEFFAPKQPETVEARIPAGTEIIITAQSAGEGIRFAVAAMPGSTITNVDLANGLHTLSHQIGSAAEQKESDGSAG